MSLDRPDDAPHTVRGEPGWPGYVRLARPGTEGSLRAPPGPDRDFRVDLTGSLAAFASLAYPCVRRPPCTLPAPLHLRLARLTLGPDLAASLPSNRATPSYGMVSVRDKLLPHYVQCVATRMHGLRSPVTSANRASYAELAPRQDPPGATCPRLISSRRVHRLRRSPRGSALAGRRTGGRLRLASAGPGSPAKASLSQARRRPRRLSALPHARSLARAPASSQTHHAHRKGYGRTHANPRARAKFLVTISLGRVQARPGKST